MGKIFDVNKEEFQQIIDLKKEIILVDFWAPWCGPCKTIGPILQDISEEVEDIIVLKVNIDEDNNAFLSAQFEVIEIPTIIIFKNSEQVDKFVGTKKKEEILNLISEISSTKENKKDESKN